MRAWEIVKGVLVLAAMLATLYLLLAAYAF